MTTDDLRVKFLDKVRTIHDLAEVQVLLEWDQQVTMPPCGAAQRARQQAALAGVAHRLMIDPELGDLLELLARDAGLDEPRRADVRETARLRDRAVKIPVALVTARAEACALAQAAWVEARANDDYPAFRPHLDRVLGLTRDVAAALGAANPYDALLDEYEPGTTEAELTPLFAGLKSRLVPLLGRIAASPWRPDPAPLCRAFPRAGQEEFGRRLVSAMGYDMAAGRLDVSAHPFTSGTMGDVRITTRYDESFLNTSVFGTLHEAGHALYEQGLDPDRYREPAGGFCSMGIHESQSRLWENMIGRSRPFWNHFFPLLRATFPGTLDDVTGEDFYRAINACAPSRIRVEADEVTYNLHIVLRFELESALVSGRLSTVDLPGAWNDRVRELLGLAPESNRTGVLQDVHWSAGLFGYFPTYTLGNLYAAQFMERIRLELPDLDDCLARGELIPIKTWLNRRIHAPGRIWPAPELCRRITGQPLSSRPFLDYLTAKYGELYGF